MSTPDHDPGMAGAGPPDPAADGWKPVKDDGFIGLVGPIYRRERGERWAFGFKAGGKHANLRGVVQGGMLMTFADRALGRNAWKAAGDRAVATIDFNMQFVTAGQLGEFIEVEPEVVRRTASLVFMRGTLTTGGRVVATCAGVWKILG
ncbi:MAG TPA: PaaI family thioesterase [Beijerinckiaceae bacterium]|jgi:acyl-coenzyme A thioesterase PaaI-like protein